MFRLEAKAGGTLQVQEGGPSVQPFHLRDKKVGFTGLTSQIWRIKGLAHRELHI